MKRLSVFIYRLYLENQNLKRLRTKLTPIKLYEEDV